jgi:hypothetical protein
LTAAGTTEKQQSSPGATTAIRDTTARAAGRATKCLSILIFICLYPICPLLFCCREILININVSTDKGKKSCISPQLLLADNFSCSPPVSSGAVSMICGSSIVSIGISGLLIEIVFGVVLLFVFVLFVKNEKW